MDIYSRDKVLHGALVIVIPVVTASICQSIEKEMMIVQEDYRNAQSNQ